MTLKKPFFLGYIFILLINCSTSTVNPRSNY